MTPVPSTLRLGWVPDLNARPLVDGLDQDGRLELVAGTPAELAQHLEEGTLDLALAPAVILGDHPSWVGLSDAGVAARGPGAVAGSPVAWERGASSREPSATSEEWRARGSEVAWPMPRLAPVTRATLTVKSIIADLVSPLIPPISART